MEALYTPVAEHVGHMKWNLRNEYKTYQTTAGCFLQVSLRHYIVT